MCGPTQRDADGAFYNDLLRASAPAALHLPLASRADSAAAALGGDTAEALARSGLRLWTGGLGHAEWREAAAVAAAPGAAADDELE